MQKKKKKRMYVREKLNTVRVNVKLPSKLYTSFILLTI